MQEDDTAAFEALLHGFRALDEARAARGARSPLTWRVDLTPRYACLRACEQATDPYAPAPSTAPYDAEAYYGEITGSSRRRWATTRPWRRNPRLSPRRPVGAAPDGDPVVGVMSRTPQPVDGRVPAHVMMRVPDLLDGLSEDRELVFLSSSAQVAQLVPVSELRVSRVGRA